MNASKLSASLLTVASLHFAIAADAASIDMNDPRRSLGREGNVRVDAQLIRETVCAGTPIGFIYQIQNLSSSSVAIANTVTNASYDDDSRTITIVVGSEVPPDGNMPQVVIIGPGQTKVFQDAVTPVMTAGTLRSVRGMIPRFVQVKVAILRDLRPFLPLILSQEVRVKQRLSDEQFEQWFEANDTIHLNAVPVQFVRVADGDAEHRDASRRDR